MTVISLTSGHIKAMESIRGGADVFSLHISSLLLEIKAAFPEMILICEPMGTYSNEEGAPLFGAILKREGRDFLDQIQTGLVPLQDIEA